MVPRHVTMMRKMTEVAKSEVRVFIRLFLPMPYGWRQLYLWQNKVMNPSMWENVIEFLFLFLC